MANDFFIAYKARLERNEAQLIDLIKKVKEKYPEIEIYTDKNKQRHLKSVTFIKDESVNTISFHEVPYRWSGCGYSEGGNSHYGGPNCSLPFTEDDVANNLKPIKGIRKSQVESFKDKKGYLKWFSWLTLYENENTESS